MKGMMVFMGILGVLTLSSCGGDKYHFVSARIEEDGEIKEYNIGDELPNGLRARKDTMTIQIKPDGVVVVETRVAFFSEKTTGTWEEVEGEPNKITIIVENDPVTCECEGSTLTMFLSDSSSCIVFRK